MARVFLFLAVLTSQLYLGCKTDQEIRLKHAHKSNPQFHDPERYAVLKGYSENLYNDKYPEEPLKLANCFTNDLRYNDLCKNAFGKECRNIYVLTAQSEIAPNVPAADLPEGGQLLVASATDVVYFESPENKVESLVSLDGFNSFLSKIDIDLNDQDSLENVIKFYIPVNAGLDWSCRVSNENIPFDKYKGSPPGCSMDYDGFWKKVIKNQSMQLEEFNFQFENNNGSLSTEVVSYSYGCDSVSKTVHNYRFENGILYADWEHEWTNCYE